MITLTGAVISHLYFMVFELSFWGHGNLFYILTSLSLLYKTIISTFLFTEWYYYIFASHGFRLFNRIISFIDIFYWIAKLVADLLLIFNNDSIMDSAEGIVTAYFILMNAPELIPSAYIFMKELFIDEGHVYQQVKDSGKQMPKWMEDSVKERFSEWEK